MTAAVHIPGATPPPALHAIRGWRAQALAAAAGAVATLGHAPFFWFPAFLVGAAVLFLLIDAADPAKPRWSAFARTWWFGVGYFLSGLYWISSAFLVDAATFGLGLGVASVAAIAAGLSVFWALAIAFVRRFWGQGPRRAVLFGLAILVAELARGHLFGGFPWHLAGYIWPAGGAISQTASVIGVYGLTALTMMAAGALAVTTDREARAAARFGPALVVALSLGVLWGLGHQRLNTAEIAIPGATPIVRVVDAGYDQQEKWRLHPDTVLARFLERTGPPRESRANIVIWPEGAIPSSGYALVYGVDEADSAFAMDAPRAAAIARRLGDRVLIAGATRCSPQAECEAFFARRRGIEGLRFANSAFVLDGVSGEPRLAGVYDKHRLTPFGEFIPLWSVFSQINFAPLQQIGAGFTPGPEPRRLVVAADAQPAVIQICYETLFPGFAPRGDARPGWIVNVTNDAWFGAGTGPHQHFNIARYRAIEEGLPMARAASGGASAIVDAYGRAKRIAPPTLGYTEDALPATLEPTLYARFDWAILGALGAAMAAVAFAPRGTRFGRVKS